MELLSKLHSIRDRFFYLEELMTDPEVISDMKKYARINKEYKDLIPLVEAHRTYEQLLGNIQTADEMLLEDDAEMKAMAQDELESLRPKRQELEEEIKQLLIPKDPDDSRDIIMEIRSGAGGDEASIFAGDLYRLYSKYIELQGWKTELIDVNEGSAGGFNKVIFEVMGNGVYGKLKFESGAHRVQRVPRTESQGRVHTSAATVVIMPKFEMEDIDIKKDDLKVDTFRSSGAGGQHVNKTESGVRFTHLPTGIVAESTDGRSQIKNREIAMQRLYDKIRKVQREKHESEVASTRRSLVGSGDRSDKIRTYNYPQNRVTDHRINMTSYALDKVMDGNIGEFIEALQVAENAKKLQDGSAN
jgi:peptide chain release factor 1